MYEVVGRYLKGILVIGYGLEDENGENLKVSYSDFLKLVRSNKIRNFYIVTVNSKDYIVGRVKQLDELPSLSSVGGIKLKDRIVEEGKVVGYEVRSNRTGNTMNIQLDKIWELAFGGFVEGAVAKFDGRKLIIVDEFKGR